MNWSDFLLRLRAMFLARRVEAEMEEELNAHLELQVRKHTRAGIDADQATELARREFGSLANAKDQCRDERRVTLAANLGRDLKYAARAFRRDPGFSALAAFVLAIGIGANVAVFSVMDAMLLRTLPVEDPGRLFRTARASGPNDDPSGGASSYPVYLQMRERTRPFADLMAYEPTEPQTVTLNRGIEERLYHQAVSGNYFQVLGVRPALGRLISANDDQPVQNPVAVISDRLWRERFDRSTAALGSKVRIEDQMFEVIGVAPRELFGVEIGKFVDVWTSVAAQPQDRLRNDHLFWLQTLGRLRPGVSIGQAAAPMQAVIDEVMLEDVRLHAPPGTPKSVIDRFLAGMKIKGVPAGGGIAALGQQYKRSLELVMILVAVVLLIACTNVANLLLAKGAARRREIAIRISLGAGRLRVLQQLMTESTLLAAVAAAFGILIARWTTPLFVRMLTSSSQPAELAIGMDVRLLAYAGFLTLITVTTSGLIPAFHSAKADTAAALKSGGRMTGEKSRRQRKLLVAAQIALSLVLVIGAALFGRTLTNLLSEKPGFEPRQVLVTRLTLPRPGDEMLMYPGAWTELLQRVQAFPGTEKASVSSATLFDGAAQSIGLRTDIGQRASMDPTAVIFFVSPDYFTTLRIGLVEGRSLEDSALERNASDVVVVNQAFARKFFGGADPIGHKVTRMADSPNWSDISGVVRDVKVANLRGAGPPIIYVPYGAMRAWVSPQGHPGFAMTLQVRGRQDTSSLIRELRREAGVRFKVSSVSQQQEFIDNTLVRERLLSRVAGLFGVVSLILAALGLYGVMNYAVAQRRQEIGVRMALGAAPMRIVVSLMQESTAVVLSGMFLGLLLFGLGNRVARSALYGLAPNDPGALMSAVIVLFFATFVAGLFPACKAAATDPIITLRNE
jgi:predicted permease